VAELKKQVSEQQAKVVKDPEQVKKDYLSLKFENILYDIRNNEIKNSLMLQRDNNRILSIKRENLRKEVEALGK
jgi:hypothetical protein